MLKPMTGKCKVAALTGIVLCGLFLLVTPLVTVLTITDAKTNVPVLCVKVRDGQEFSLAFTHSVNKRPVRDYIRVVGEHLLVVKSEYDSFGAGMPETSQGEMTVRLTPERKLAFTNINRQLPEISVFVGTVANHILIAGDREIPLTDLAPPETPLTFKIDKISYITLMRTRQVAE